MPGPLTRFVRYQRAVRMAELGAARDLVTMRRPGLRCYVVRSRGLVVESRMFGACRLPLLAAFGDAPTVAHLTVPLEGELVVRRGGRERLVGVGQALLDPGYVVDERWEGRRFAALCVEWTAAHGEAATAAELTVSPADLAALAAFAADLRADEVGDGDVAPLLGRLRGLGLPLFAAHAVALGPAPLAAIELARAFSAVHTQLDRHPDVLDLEALLGVSSRHIRRQLQALGPWWVLPRSDWRGSLRRTRVLLAPSLSTVRGASVERIAGALGYRSAPALLHALDAEGVPPPSRTRAIAHGLAADS